MKAINKRLIGSLLLVTLIMLAPYSNLGFVSSPGMITAEAASTVALSKKTASLAVGGKTTVQLKNINTKKSITWTSSKKSVATVKKGSNGKATITAKKKGAATITAKYNGKKYTIKVTVKSPALSKKAVSLTAGKKTTVQLKNIVTSKKITWSSNKKSVATVKKGSSRNSRFSANNYGPAYMSGNNKVKTYLIKVSVKAATRKLYKSCGTLAVGASTTLTLSNPVKGKSTTWKSSNSSVASVKKNSNTKATITAKKAGSVTITATHNKKKYTFKLTVKAQSLSKTSLSMTVGGSSAITLNNPVSGKKTTASSSNTKVATVSVSGNNKITVKAVGAGTVTVKVVHNGKTLSCKVTVTKPATPSKPSTSTPNTTKPSTGGSMTTKPSTPSTTTPTTPSTGGSTTTKPSTPSTEAPSKPSTPETNPPQTEAPKPTYVYDFSGFTSRSVVEGSTGMLTVSTSDPSLSFSSSNTSVVMVSKSGEGICNFSALAPGSAVISAKAYDGTVKATATITVTAKPVLSVENANITVAGGKITPIYLVTTLPENQISYSFSSENLEFRTFDYSVKALYFVGRIAGQYQVKISGGGTSVVVNVTVTSTDSTWVAYDSWLRGVLNSCGYGSASTVEVFKNLGAYLVDNYDYTGNPDYMTLYSSGGGSCVAHTDLFIDVAERYFGLEAYSNDMSSGHSNAVVTINGVKWAFDAGSNGTAKNRSFSAIPSDESIPVYRYSYENGLRELS